MLGLRWRSIDFEHGTAAITHQLDRPRELAALKTPRSRRTIELPPELIAKLRAHKLASPYSAPDNFVFASRTGGGLDQRNVGGRALARAVKRAELDEPAPTFHDFRHTFASAWIASGGDMVEQSAHLGHADPGVTSRTYAHEFERAARSDARRARIAAMYDHRANNGVTGEVSEGQDSAVSEPLELSG